MRVFVLLRVTVVVLLRHQLASAIPVPATQTSGDSSCSSATPCTSGKCDSFGVCCAPHVTLTHVESCSQTTGLVTGCIGSFVASPTRWACGLPDGSVCSAPADCLSRSCLGRCCVVDVDVDTTTACRACNSSGLCPPCLSSVSGDNCDPNIKLFDSNDSETAGAAHNDSSSLSTTHRDTRADEAPNGTTTSVLLLEIPGSTNSVWPTVTILFVLPVSICLTICNCITRSLNVTSKAYSVLGCVCKRVYSSQRRKARLKWPIAAELYDLCSFANHGFRGHATFVGTILIQVEQILLYKLGQPSLQTPARDIVELARFAMNHFEKDSFSGDSRFPPSRCCNLRGPKPEDVAMLLGKSLQPGGVFLRL